MTTRRIAEATCRYQNRAAMYCARTLALLAALSLAGIAPRAHAQACHTPAPEPRDQHDGERPIRAALAVLAAAYDVDGYAGHYEGTYASFAYRQPWWSLEVVLPAYRLDRRQGVEYGLGDMVLTARGVFLRRREGDIQLGVELPVMLPTGDEERSLGMGHVMPMPNLFFAGRLRPLILQASLGYGFAIGMDSHHDAHGAHGAHGAHHGGHHTGSTKQRDPLVNPMNMSELEHQLLAGVELPRGTRVHARWWGAVPIRSEGGVLRQSLALGASLTLSRLDVTLELQRALRGRAFDYKGVLQLGASF